MNINLGDNCKYCKCAKCKYWEKCGILEGNTQWYCENDCLGEGSATTVCSEFERNKR
ncbi:MAG: hypothetical protein WAP07_02460 [Acutalibacteraceae bacterium]